MSGVFILLPFTDSIGDNFDLTTSITIAASVLNCEIYIQKHTEEVDTNTWRLESSFCTCKYKKCRRKVQANMAKPGKDNNATKNLHAVHRFLSHVFFLTSPFSNGTHEPKLQE